jgi:hypothetical protein
VDGIHLKVLLEADKVCLPLREALGNGSVNGQTRSSRSLPTPDSWEISMSEFVALPDFDEVRRFDDSDPHIAEVGQVDDVGPRQEVLGVRLALQELDRQATVLMTVLAQDPEITVDGQPLAAAIPVPAGRLQRGPANHRFHVVDIGSRFSGASAVGPFTHKAAFQNEHTRTPDSRPIATGLQLAAAELADFGLPDLRTFSDARIDALLTDYVALPPGDSMERRNLARRIGHLLRVVSPAKQAAVMAAHPSEFVLRVGTISFGWNRKEVFNGKVDADLRFQPGGSSVIAYFSLFTSFSFQSHMFGFHSDELCAHHISSVRADPTAGPSSLSTPEIATMRPRSSPP